MAQCFYWRQAFARRAASVEECYQLALLGPPARQAMRGMSLPFEREFFALRDGRFSAFVLLAACAACGKAGPVMGLRPLLGPLASPRSTPLQIFNYRVFARAARLLLRELPSLRSGDFPARRAMPSAAFVLHEKFRAFCPIRPCTDYISIFTGNLLSAAQKSSSQGASIFLARRTGVYPFMRPDKP